MKIFDLKKQFKLFEKDINEKVSEILSSGSYILGNNVKTFEKNVSSST